LIAFQPQAVCFFAMALAGMARGGVVLIAFYTLICKCRVGFPEWSGQAVPRHDGQAGRQIIEMRHDYFFPGAPCP